MRAVHLSNWLHKSFCASAGVGFASLSFSDQKVSVRPCVINNQPHIIYPRGLQTNEPELFRQLSNYFCSKGYTLKEDQRQSGSSHRLKNERRRWAPILLFATGLMLENVCYAGGDVPHEKAHQKHELQLISSYTSDRQAGDTHVETTPSYPTVPSKINADAANLIFNMLTQHYSRKDTDPDYILDDFKEIANYYSGFPQVMTILNDMSGKRWRLVYREHNWATVANGNAFRVESAVIHFNTRSAAQLKLYSRCKANPACIASPADAMLHEMLHAHSMLVNTNEFLANGGMSRVLYPYKHEYAIIEKERALYASMSRMDGFKRPQRTDHTGRLVKAQCSTCIQ